MRRTETDTDGAPLGIEECRELARRRLPSFVGSEGPFLSSHLRARNDQPLPAPSGAVQLMHPDDK